MDARCSIDNQCVGVSRSCLGPVRPSAGRPGARAGAEFTAERLGLWRSRTADHPALEFIGSVVFSDGIPQNVVCDVLFNSGRQEVGGILRPEAISISASLANILCCIEQGWSQNTASYAGRLGMLCECYRAHVPQRTQHASDDVLKVYKCQGKNGISTSASRDPRLVRIRWWEYSLHLHCFNSPREKGIAGSQILASYVGSA